MPDKHISWLTDFKNRRIRLTQERLDHIREDHPEMREQLSKIKETLLQPEVVIQSKSEPKAQLFYRLFKRTPVTMKYLCLVVMETSEDHFLLTAYFTDRIKKGEVIWETK